MATDMTIEQEAAERFYRVKDRNDDYKIDDLMAWLDTPEKIDAYAEVAKSWGKLNSVNPEEVATPPLASTSDPLQPALNVEPSLMSIPTPIIGQFRNRLLGGFVTLVILAITITSYIGLPTRHHANIGEIYRFALDDNSQIMLESNSQVTVYDGWGNRTVELISGSAYFDIVTNKDKPFRVLVNGITTTVLGTQFNVTRLGSDINIAVKEGRVQVENGNNDLVILQDNEVVAIGQRQMLSKQSNMDVDRLMEWRNGSIHFDNAPFEAVVARLQNYYAYPIQFVNPSTREKLVSGTFNHNDVPGFLAAVSELTGVQFEQASSGSIIIH